MSNPANGDTLKAQQETDQREKKRGNELKSLPMVIDVTTTYSGDITTWNIRQFEDEKRAKQGFTAVITSAFVCHCRDWRDNRINKESCDEKGCQPWDRSRVEKLVKAIARTLPGRVVITWLGENA